MVKGVIITGRPGIGKTTTFFQTIKLLREENVSIGGFLSKAVTDRGKRIGFEVTDLRSNRKGWLARIGNGVGPKIGKYIVTLQDFEEIGVSALSYALENENIKLIAVDEMGPMELCSTKFTLRINEVFSGEKPFFITLHLNLRDHPMLQKEVEVFEITLENRRYLADTLALRIKNLVRGA